jgi:hypothetical protein
MVQQVLVVAEFDLPSRHIPRLTEQNRSPDSNLSRISQIQRQDSEV